MKYMIHACPNRMWYVENFLMPSLIDSGVSANDIIVWNDTEGKGNLFSTFDSFESLNQYPGNTWHLQDDVILCRNFQNETKKYERVNKVVGGFCAITNYTNEFLMRGEVPAKYLWWTFPCVMIPNYIAVESSRWFYKAARYYKGYKYYIESKKGDDSFFVDFMLKFYHDRYVINLWPNIVDHIDYILGGSVANSSRKHNPTSAYFKDPDLVGILKEKIDEFKSKNSLYS